MDFTTYCRHALQTLREDGRYRTFHPFLRLAHLPTQATSALHDASAHHAPQNDDDTVTIWCSNDYLNMSQHPVVMARAQQVLQETGIGAGGTRNISGTSTHHQQLEQRLAAWHDKEAALLFTSGYVANYTTLSTLARHIEGLIIFSDAMNHNSMIEGIRANSATCKRIFRHNDPEHLTHLIAQEDPARPKLVAWESLYSMDGDIAPNQALLEVCQRHGALSYVDEVHAVGLYGPKGAGICAQEGIADHIDLIEGTLAKAVGCIGGYICGNQSLVDFVRSFGAGFIFTTALPPMIAAAAKTSIDILCRADEQRAELQQYAARLRGILDDYRIPYITNQTHIVPVLVGDAKKCKRVSDLLLARAKLYLQPINYPTVAIGTERLRITPSPQHSAEQIDYLCQSLDAAWQELNLPRQE